GRFSTTGISGLALGSGSGWLERKCGLTGDKLLTADVVTADGRLVKCSLGENSDLYWGLRGGRGNFGVVTSFVFRLHEVGPMLDGGRPKGINGYMKAEFMEEMSDAAIEKFVEYGAVRPSPTCQLLLEPMGGAISKMGDDETALGRRDVSWCYHALAMWMEPGEEAEAAHGEWARKLATDLEPETTEGVYLNFTSDEGEERVRKSYGPEKYARLVELKDKYDPANLFHLNGNIKPSIEATARAERGA